MGKVVTKDEIIKIVRQGQADGKTFAATNGCFDIDRKSVGRERVC